MSPENLGRPSHGLATGPAVGPARVVGGRLTTPATPQAPWFPAPGLPLQQPGVLLGQDPRGPGAPRGPAPWPAVGIPSGPGRYAVPTAHAMRDGPIMLQRPAMAPWPGIPPQAPYGARHGGAGADGGGGGGTLSPLMAERLDNEIAPFLAACSPRPEERWAVRTLVTVIEAMAQNLWIGCRAVLFGSQPVGLALPASDLDIVIQLPASDISWAASGKSVQCASYQIFAFE